MGIEDVRIEINGGDVSRLAKGEEFRMFEPEGYHSIEDPFLYFFGELQMDDGSRGHYFFNQTSRSGGYRGFSEQFQVLRGDKDTKIPLELLGFSVDGTVGEALEKEICEGVSSYYLDYDSPVNIDEKSAEQVEKEKRGFSEVEKYAVKSGEQVCAVYNALFHAFSRAHDKSRRYPRSLVRANNEEILRQINEIGRRSNSIFPRFSEGRYIFPATNYEVVDFIEGLGKQYPKFSVDKMILSGKIISQENYKHIQELIRTDGGSE